MNTLDHADDNNLEIFSLFWLDALINKDESRKTQAQLRTVINHVKTFQDPMDLLHCIQHSSSDDRIILITSGQLSQNVIPQIHSQMQVVSIYIYCMNKIYYEEQWHSYKKVSRFS